jgi:hypothetical protein
MKKHELTPLLFQDEWSLCMGKCWQIEIQHGLPDDFATIAPQIDQKTESAEHEQSCPKQIAIGGFRAIVERDS